MAFNNNFQKLVYFIFGTNFVVGPQIKEQINLLKDKVPPVFKGRALDDLGCGDGKITIRLKEVFQPQKLRGFDVNAALVWRAKNNGIDAQVMNLDRFIPQGELAVMWGVLHHLKDRETCLKRISQNYSMAFIREPLKNKAINGLEMGQPLVKEEIEQLVNKYLPDAQTFYFGHCIFVFFISPDFKSTPKY